MSVDPLGAFWSFPGEHVGISLERINEYPLLADCLDVWRRLGVDRLPATVDPVQFPRTAIRGLNLFEYVPEADDWRIRIVGSLVTDHVGQELRGTGLVQNFSEPDRDTVRAALQAAADRRAPDLMRRIFHDPRGVSWAYIRLYLPLSSDGSKVDRFATVIDPGSFGRLTSGPTTFA
ncbi:hypothetical protein BAL199_14130 [alpha proteobacterium BAL199]|jgi:hypothetical protein|nr:hypothetical protein BAL199_14130 [alpha proteobacterium BAL199]